MAQLKTKFIADNAVNENKMRLSQDAFLRARNAANSGDVNILKVNASDRIVFGSVPQTTTDASADDDLVRYSQLLAFAEGSKPKQAVATIALADIDLAVAADPGAISGHTLTAGQRILLAGQTASEENGIYVAVDEADPTTWTRALDYNLESEIPGSYTAVQFGDEAGEIYITTSSPAALDTDPIVFIKRAAGVQASQVEELLILDATDITNQYVDLAEVASSTASISLFALEGPIQEKGVDYTISLTGGAGGVTRITFAGGLATGGASELVDTDKIIVQYSYLA